jgi:hypothetical protein
MRHLFIVICLFISFYSFGQYKVFVAVQDERIREVIIDGINKYEDDIVVVYERNASDYILRAVTKEFPLGVAASVVITKPLTKGKEVWSVLVDAQTANLTDELLSLDADYEYLDEIIYQSCITSKDNAHMTADIYEELMKVIGREKAEFRRLFGN